MLTFDQIITLSDKGFSPDQIVKLTGEDLPTNPPADPPAGPPADPPADPPEDPPTNPPADPPAAPPENPLSSVLSEAIKGFSSEVAEMKKALQASNIRTVAREDVPPSKSADDILAEIIHPTISKEVSNK